MEVCEGSNGVILPIAMSERSTVPPDKTVKRVITRHEADETPPERARRKHIDELVVELVEEKVK
jgi:hypothetical protein